MRSKLLRESLEERMRHAQDYGEYHHKEEKLYLMAQVDRLRHKQARRKGKLAELRRAKAPAELIRAADVASERRRH